MFKTLKTHELHKLQIRGNKPEQTNALFVKLQKLGWVDSFGKQVKRQSKPKALWLCEDEFGQEKFHKSFPVSFKEGTFFLEEQHNRSANFRRPPHHRRTVQRASGGDVMTKSA